MPKDQGKVIGDLITRFAVHVDVRGRRFVTKNGRVGSIGSPQESVYDRRGFESGTNEEQDSDDMSYLIVELKWNNSASHFEERKGRKSKLTKAPPLKFSTQVPSSSPSTGSNVALLTVLL